MKPLSIDERIRLQRIAGHHSTSDWDFSVTAWILDPAYYVSAPSSLKQADPLIKTVLHHSVTGPIAEGRISEYIRFYRSRGTTRRYTFRFRVQWPDGSWTPESCYYIGLKASADDWDQPIDRAVFGRIITGSAADIGTNALNRTLAQNTWHHVRVTWWVSEGVLIVRLELETGGEWAKLCNDWTHTDNLWYESSINRVGLGYVSLLGTVHNTWHDDTEIYKRAP